MTKIFGSEKMVGTPEKEVDEEMEYVQEGGEGSATRISELTEFNDAFIDDDAVLIDDDAYVAETDTGREDQAISETKYSIIGKIKTS